MDRAALLEQKRLAMRKALCLCWKSDPHGRRYPKAHYETWTGPTSEYGTPFPGKRTHLKTCPARDEDAVWGQLKPLFEEQLDAEARATDAEAKLAATRREKPTAVGFDPHDIAEHLEFRHGGAIDRSKAALALLTDLARATGGRVVTFHEKDELARYDFLGRVVVRDTGYSTDNPFYRALFPTRSRAKAFFDIARALRAWHRRTYRAGYEHGAALLRRLANGEITLDKFDEEATLRPPEKDVGEE